MMNPKLRIKRHLKYIVLMVSMSVGITISMGQGCSRFSTLSGSSSSSSTSPSGSGTAPAQYQANTKTVGLAYGKQILSHFTSCLGSGIPSSRTLQMYSTQQGSVTTTGAASTLTGPSLMASTAIAGEVCQDLILSEATNQRIFIGFNLTSGTTLPSSSVMGAAIQRIARSCWARDPDANENQMLLNAINSSFTAGSSPTMTHDAALFMCTTMLSSLATLAL